MQRIFTETCGRFAKGDSRDYPVPTWDQIAKSAKKPLDKITKPLTEAALAGVNGKKPRKAKG